jgi:molybdate transport system ATP-binding protein
MDNSFLILEGVAVQIGGAKLLDGLSWKIERGEQWAVVGPSGSGKTVLGHVLIGRQFAGGAIRPEGRRIVMVEQQHRFRGRPGSTELYYQQRFNSQDADQTITVAEELAASGVALGSAPGEPAGAEAGEGDLLDRLHVRPLLNKPLIQLSNGENKRVQLAIALLERPEMLILDNPFPGLDVEGRRVLHGIINGLATGGMQLLLITGEREIPDCITHIGRLENGRWTYLGSRDEYRPAERPLERVQLDEAILSRLKEGGLAADGASGERGAGGTDGAGGTGPVIEMRDVTVRYGDASILDGVSWTVEQGERWNVSGPNGAGKSTLLSLITGDNPQAYANEIWLFGRRRGTGETIWDIKQKIGFVSPELHLYFDSGASCLEVVGSGIFDTIGLFRQLTPEQEERVMLWMRLLSLEDLRGRRLAQLSAGQQRMVLLARALIKNPPMLILDEPCQGLDDGQTAYFRELVTVLCKAFDKTLVYVSHYRQELPGCIDKFLRLEAGRRVE